MQKQSYFLPYSQKSGKQQIEKTDNFEVRLEEIGLNATFSLKISVGL